MATNSKPINWTWIGIMALILITILLILLKSCNSKKQVVYITHRDTTYLTKYIHDTVKVVDHVETPTVTGYKEDPRVDSFITFELKHDTIRVLNHDTLWRTINTQFIANWPTNPKIIRGIFSRDSLKLDLYYPSGKVFSNAYGVDLAQYTYTWEDNKLKATKVKLNPFKLIHFESYAYPHWNVLTNTPGLAVDGTLTYKNFGLWGFVSAQLSKSPFEIKLGTRVKLK